MCGPSFGTRHAISNHCPQFKMTNLTVLSKFLVLTTATEDISIHYYLHMGGKYQLNKVQYNTIQSTNLFINLN